jgi:cytidylate kinase
LKNSPKLSVNIIPVIAIDGPSASGKGTVADKVANALCFNYLDSGALYRIVAYAAIKNNIAWNDAALLGELAESLAIQFKDGNIILNGDNVTEAVRSEEMSRGASEVAIHKEVRMALLELQHSFRHAPGLVADGRDMASVVFTDAKLKIFLTATAEVRAERRYKQLVNKGMQADYTKILADLQQRDLRDSQRTTSPLIQATEALFLDTTHLSIDQAVEFVLKAYK